MGRFLGRERELRTLEDQLSDARNGQSRLVLVLGEPGIGKTRLIDEFARRARAGGAGVCWGRASAAAGMPPLRPWIQVVETCLQGRRLAALGPQVATDLAGLLPRLRTQPLAATAPATDETPEARFRLFEAVATVLRLAAARRPLLVVHDDLQAADPASLELLAFVARELAHTRLLVVAACCDVDVGEAHPVRRLLGGVEARSLPLGGLDRRAVGALIAEIVDAPPPPSLAAAVHRATGGNPLFASELVQLLSDENRLDAVRSGDVPVVPVRVQDVLQRRVARLSATAQQVLRVAAVAGHEFAVSLIARAGGWERHVVRAHLDEAAAARIVRGGDGNDDRFAFRHALTRDVLAGALATPDRRDLHLRVGQVLERQVAPDHAVLAHHFLAAGSPRAVAHARRAGDEAVALHAYEDAVGHYRRARAALELLPEGAQALALDLSIDLGLAQLRAGAVDAARTTCREAGVLARRLGSGEGLARAALALGAGWSWGVGAGRDDPELSALLQESHTVLPEAAHALRVQVLSRLAVARYWSATHEDVAGAAPLARDALDLARRAGDERALRIALAARHWVDCAPGGSAARLELASELVQRAAVADDREALLLGRAMRVVDLLELGDVPAADAEIARFAALADRLRQPVSLMYAAGFRVMRRLASGDLEAAEAGLGDVLRAGRFARSEVLASIHGAQLFVLRHEQGRLGELREVVESVAEGLAQIGHLAAYTWRCGLALLLSEVGDDDGARRLLGRLAAGGFADLTADAQRGVSLALLAEVCARLGERAHAETLYPLLLEYAGADVVGPFGMVCHGAAARYLGLLATTSQRPEVAAAHFEHALVRNAHTSARPQLARTQLAYAELLRGSGRPEDTARSRELLEAALTTASALGMPAVVERAAAIRRAHEHATPTAPPAGARASGVLRRDGDFWTFQYEGRTLHLKDARGLHYLARLLRQPGRALHVLDLVQAVARPNADAAATGSDRRQRSALRGRLRAARDELEDAERLHDLGRAEAARTAVAQLTDDLGVALGAHARLRGAGSPAERARLMVTQRIKAVIARLRDRDTQLARHLATHVATGYLCAYRPDAERPITWDVR